jgi:hypothetical protein
VLTISISVFFSKFSFSAAGCCLAEISFDLYVSIHPIRARHHPNFPPSRLSDFSYRLFLVSLSLKFVLTTHQHSNLRQRHLTAITFPFTTTHATITILATIVRPLGHHVP